MATNFLAPNQSDDPLGTQDPSVLPMRTGNVSFDTAVRNARERSNNPQQTRPDEPQRARNTSTSRRTSFQVRNSVDPGPLSDYIDSDQFRVVPTDISYNEMNEMMQDGTIPIPGPEMEIPDIVPIEIDTSRSRQALEDYAEAKIQAAKQGSDTSRAAARAANTRFLTTALGQNLAQLTSGTAMPNRTQQARAQAQGNINRVIEDTQRAQQVQAIAPTEAEMRQAELQRQEDVQNQEARQDAEIRQTDYRNQQDQQRAENRQRYSSAVLDSARADRNASREALLAESTRRSIGDNSPNRAREEQAITADIENTQRAYQDLSRIAQAINTTQQMTNDLTATGVSVEAVKETYGITDDNQAQRLKQEIDNYLRTDVANPDIGGYRYLDRAQQQLREKRNELEQRIVDLQSDRSRAMERTDRNERVSPSVQVPNVNDASASGESPYRNTPRVQDDNQPGPTSRSDGSTRQTPETVAQPRNGNEESEESSGRDHVDFGGRTMDM